MARFPILGSDNGTWGVLLNEYLSDPEEPHGTIRAMLLRVPNAVDTIAITKNLLDTDAQTKLSAISNSEWNDVTNKPIFIALLEPRK